MEAKTIKIQVVAPFVLEGRAFNAGKVYTVTENEDFRRLIESGAAREIPSGSDGPISDEDILTRLKDLGVPGIVEDKMTSQDFLNAARVRGMQIYKIF